MKEFNVDFYMFEFYGLGFFVGLLSGFFGIGGGTILIPSLLVFGYDTKVAIGISIIQMVFSSIYGSYLNHKNGSLDIEMVIFIGFGGFFGGLFSGYISSLLDTKTLEIIFLSFALFALFRVFIKIDIQEEEKELNRGLLFLIGSILGALSMTIGVGGSILLVPILVGFLHVNIKKAIASGLFFVVFSSVSGFISYSLHNVLDYKSGIIIGISSLLGVYMGIKFKDKVDHKVQKNMLVVFYLLIVLYLVKRVFF